MAEMMDVDESSGLASLDNFPRIPSEGKVTVAESHLELHSLPSSPVQPATARGFFPTIAHYTLLDKDEITSRFPFKIPPIKTSRNKASLLIPKQHGISKAIWDAWWENGFKGICNLSQENDSTVAKFVLNAAYFCAKLAEAPSKLLSLWFPHWEWKTEALHNEYSRVRSWKESWIRVLEWHPSEPLMAVALNDDSVRLCHIGRYDVPMLRCQEQVNVSSIAWRPVVTTELAVGCEDCIVIWYLTAPASTTYLKKDRTEILRMDGHGPISCVSYAPNGLHLLSSSAKDPNVYVWDTYLWRGAPIRRISGGGIPIALYSPLDCRFLTASPSNKFWIWEVKDFYWECKRWETPTSKTMIEAACWNPEGSILLFATDGVIYGMYFELSPVGQFVAQTSSIVKRVFNIEECNVLDEDENLSYKVGGRVRHMEWDPSGHRVALMFDDSEMIAVFRVTVKSRNELLVPLGFIRGHRDEYPLAMSFQKNFNAGALLTIAWSSGRIQYFPMVFALPTNDVNILHEDHYREQNVIHSRPSKFAAAGFVSPRLSVSGAEPVSSNVSELFNESSSGPTSPSRLYSVLRGRDNA